MQYVMRYHLKPNKSAAFKKWLLENQSLLAENNPEGWTYLGTWFTVRGLGRYQCETRWELEDYASLGGGWGNDISQRLSREWLEFVDQAREGENCVMKSAADVSVFE